MSRHPRTKLTHCKPHNPYDPHNPRIHRTARRLGDKLRIRLCAWLAVVGVAAAVAITAFTIFPATARSIDHATPMPGGRPEHQPHLVALSLAGGDLKRAVRLTRRSQSRTLGQLRSWTDEGLTMPAQATYRVVSKA